MIWLIKTVDGMIPDPASPDGPKIEEPWTTWDVRKHRNPNSAIKVPVLGPETADLTHIVMDVMDEVIDKHEDWLDLPPAKIKDLISHAMMMLQ